MNILAEDQKHVCHALSAKGNDTFQSVPYRISDAGFVISEGVVACLECELIAVHEAGDHYVMIG